MASPVCEERVISRGMVACTADGPLGMRMKWHFAHPSLWSYEKCRVRIHFDPLAESPVRRTIVLAESARGEKAGSVICEAESLDPTTEGVAGNADHAKNINRALRAAMRREYRVILPDTRTGQQQVVKAESEMRGFDRMVELTKTRESAIESDPRVNSIRAQAGDDLTKQAYRNRPTEIDEEALAKIERLEREAVERGDIMIT